ncbi:MAG: hypothetical protein V1755_02490 [Chloroflexota bacterium]
MLITTAWSLIRVWSSVEHADVLQEYAPWPGPVYIGITGAVFAALGLALVWGFWRRAGWAPLAFLAGAITYAAWNWADRLFLQPGALQTSWQFSLLITVLLLTFVATVALDPRNRSTFGREAHEREAQDRPIA